jgi:hypothetical protein
VAVSTLPRRDGVRTVLRGLEDAYRIHHIDTGSIVDAALTLVGR